MSDLCGCIRCTTERCPPKGPWFALPEGWRYACEICGNKGCPHHTDHSLVCTTVAPETVTSGHWQVM